MILIRFFPENFLQLIIIISAAFPIFTADVILAAHISSKPVSRVSMGKRKGGRDDGMDPRIIEPDFES